MCVQRFAIAFILTALVAPTYGSDETVAPGANMTLVNIPHVPLELARRADQYSNYRRASFAAWHPLHLHMLVTTRFGETSQVHRVHAPGGRREQLTFYREAVLGVPSYADAPDGHEYFTMVMDVGGDEFYQIYRFDPHSGERTLLTDGEHRHGGGLRSDATGAIVYSRVDADDDGAYEEFFVSDPLDPDSGRWVATVRGGGWAATDWSPDGSKVLLSEYLSVNKSHVWLLDLEDAEAGPQHLLPPGAGTRDIAYRGAEFTADGNGLYVTSDASSEFRQLTHIDLDSLTHSVLTDALPWDVSGFDLSKDGEHIAFVTNEAGRSSLYLMDTASHEYTNVPGLPRGVMGAPRWHDNSTHLAVTVTSANIPGDVFVVHAPTQSVTRWTYSESAIDPSGFPEAELIEWASFDGRMISGFLYSPPDGFDGPRPVLLSIHGGPEGQSRPTYKGSNNYFLNELGVALIYPNVRGSTGFGKSFAKLDNGMLREGAYKDIGALLDWIDARPDLDGDRVLVSGGSYGGHMTLAVATRYNDRIAASINIFGISNLRTFLENTQGYRRDLRRAEYGDEREPDIREWMDQTAPLTHVDRIRKPMLVQQGVNDPRVPKSESDQIVAALEDTGTPVWYIVFDDEGHGFRKKKNADFAFYTRILFAQDYLLD